MDTTRLQQLIDGARPPGDMIRIARAYLSGAVLRDPVAAEAWLMKAIEAEDPVFSPRAMGILAREILGRTQVIPPQDLAQICREAAHSTDPQLQELLALAENNQNFVATE